MDKKSHEYNHVQKERTNIIKGRIERIQNEVKRIIKDR